jgi:hypothetical protein
MAKGNHRAGGGIKSRVNVERPVRTGAARRGPHVAGLAQLGQKQGSHATNRGNTGYGGEKFWGPKQGISVPLGNSVALNVGGGGPGKGRTLHGQAGSQGCHGAPAPGNPMPKAKALWPGWNK